MHFFQESEPAAEKPNPSEYTYVEACEEAMELWLGFVEAPKMVSLIRKSCQYREIDELPNDELTCTDIRSFWTWLISPITDKTLKVEILLTPRLKLSLPVAVESSGVTMAKIDLCRC